MSFTPGYLGYLSLLGQSIRVTDADVTLRQEVLSDPSVFGLRDVRGGYRAKGEGTPAHPQKTIWRPSTKIVEGSFSFPLTNGQNFNEIYQLARFGEQFNLVYKLNCQQAVYAEGCRISSFSLSCAAGGVVEMSLSFSGMYIESGSVTDPYTSPEKLVTWDMVSVNGVPSATTLSDVSFEIENVLNIVYTSGNNFSESLFPMAIRIGEQTITGSVTAYERNIIPSDNIDGDVEYFSLNAASVLSIQNVPVKYYPVAIRGDLMVYTGAIAFMGVDVGPS